MAPLSHRESQSHFGLWAIISSPLILGLDLADGPSVDAIWDIVANTEVIRVSQAWAGHPGRLVANSTTYFDAQCAAGATAHRSSLCRLPDWQVWAKPMPAADAPATPWTTDVRAVGQAAARAEALAVLVVNNAATAAAEVTVPFASLGLDGPARMRDLWAHADNGTVARQLEFAQIAPHGGVMVLLTPTQRVA